MRKTNGFSLIELMVALGVLTIIATVAVPKVQVWNARNRGLQAVLEILSDFSKARTIAGYAVADDKSNEKSIKIPLNAEQEISDSNKMNVYLGIRLQIAMIFRQHEYGIYQKETMRMNDWGSAPVLKRNILPDSVYIVKINDLATIRSSSNSRRLVFTSTGLVKQQNNDSNLSEDDVPTSASNTTCDGAGFDKVLFSAIVRSEIAGSDDAIWYRIQMDPSGQYLVCMAFAGKTTSEDSAFNDAHLLSI